MRRPVCSQLVSRRKCACKKGVASRGKARAGDAKNPTNDGMRMIGIQQKTICGYYGSGQKNHTTSRMRIMRQKDSLGIASLDQWIHELRNHLHKEGARLLYLKPYMSLQQQQQPKGNSLSPAI
jgi:hypothetical protein